MYIYDISVRPKAGKKNVYSGLSLRLEVDQVFLRHSVYCVGRIVLELPDEVYPCAVPAASAVRMCRVRCSSGESVCGLFVTGVRVEYKIGIEVRSTAIAVRDVSASMRRW